MNNIWKNGHKIAVCSIIIGFLSVGLGITGFLTTNLITEPVLYVACAIAVGAAITGGVSFQKYNQLEDSKNESKDSKDHEEEPFAELLQEESFKKTQQSPFAFLRNLRTLKIIGIKPEKSKESARVLVYKRKGGK